MNKIISGLFIILGILIIVDGIFNYASLFFDQNTYYINENYTADCADVDINGEVIFVIGIFILVDGVFACFLGLITFLRENWEPVTIVSSMGPIGIVIASFILYLIVHDCISFTNYVEIFLTYPIIIYFVLALAKIITAAIYIVYKNKNNIEIISVENINDGNNGDDNDIFNIESVV